MDVQGPQPDPAAAPPPPPPADAAAMLAYLEQRIAALDARQIFTALKPRQPDTYAGDGSSRFRVNDFIMTCETYFSAVGADDDNSRVRYAATLLRGGASRWFTELVGKNAVPQTWAAFRAALTQRFLPGGATTAVRSQLAHTVQRTTIGDYADKMMTLFSQAPTMSEEERISWFKRGLKDQVRVMTEFANPDTLILAIETATKVDDIYYNSSQRSRRPDPRSSYRGNTGPEPMTLGAVGRDARATPSFRRSPPTADGPRLAKLTDEERAHLKSIGACFRCRKVGHTSAQCPARSGNASRQ